MHFLRVPACPLLGCMCCALRGALVLLVIYHQVVQDYVVSPSDFHLKIPDSQLELAVGTEIEDSRFPVQIGLQFEVQEVLL